MEIHRSTISKMMADVNYKIDPLLMGAFFSPVEAVSYDFYSLSSICISLPYVEGGNSPNSVVREIQERESFQVSLRQENMNQFLMDYNQPLNPYYAQNYPAQTHSSRSIQKKDQEKPKTSEGHYETPGLMDAQGKSPKANLKSGSGTSIPQLSKAGGRQQSSAESNPSPSNSHRSLEGLKKQKLFEEDKLIKKLPANHRRVAELMESSQELSRVSQPFSVNQSYFASDNSSKQNDDSLINGFMKNSLTNSLEDLEKDGNKQNRGSKSSKLNQEILVDLDDELVDSLENPIGFEDFKENIIEMSSTNKGSRKMQSFLPTAEPGEIAFVCEKILSQVDLIMCDTYGNFMFQCLVEVCNKEQRIALMKKAVTQVIEIVCNPKGTHSFQKLVGKIESHEEEVILTEVLMGKIKKIALDHSGTHFLQKVIQTFQEPSLDFVLEEILPSIYEIATHAQGLCVLKVFFSKFKANPDVFAKLLESITDLTEKLAQNSYGNYLIQHAIIVSFLKFKILIY
jgi:Pumilio-family RNA binding repeat